MSKRSLSTTVVSVAKKQKEVPWYHHFTKGDDEYNAYMRDEWGHEKRGDIPLFEKLCLEGAQSGLSWRTILKKREAYRKTFRGFDPKKIAKMDSKDVENILSQDGDPGSVVIRHKGKIEALIHNANCLLELQKEISFDEFIWSFVDDKPIVTKVDSIQDMQSSSEESTAMSKALKKRGFKFVGPTTCYSLMQSCGLVIDHPVRSPEYKEAIHRLDKREKGYQFR